MIEISNVSKAYEEGNRALRNVNITIEDGEFVFIMGPNGSGKTTIFKLLLKEVEATSGRIVVNDMNLGKMPRRYVPKYRRRLGVVFQDFRLLKDRNVYENVAFAQRVVGASTRRIKESVPEMLQMVGLSAKYKMYPKQLSGGDQQRVAIARALINRPEVLLADEPTGNLDSRNAMEIMRLLEDINEMGTTVVVITHSQEIVEKMGKRVIRMERGCVVSDEIEGRPTAYEEQITYDEPPAYEEQVTYAESGVYEEQVAYAESEVYEEQVTYAEPAVYEEPAAEDEQTEYDEQMTEDGDTYEN